MSIEARLAKAEDLVSTARPSDRCPKCGAAWPGSVVKAGDRTICVACGTRRPEPEGEIVKHYVDPDILDAV